MPGMIEELRAGWVSGWAFDPETTGPVEIKIELAGIVVGKCKADTHRQDVNRIHGRLATGFRVRAEALDGLTAQNILDQVKIFANLKAGQIALDLLPQTKKQIEREALLENRKTQINDFTKEELIQLLRKIIAKTPLLDLINELNPFLQHSKNLGGSVEFQAARGFAAFIRGDFAVCEKYLTNDVLQGLEVDDSAAARAADILLKATYACGKIQRASEVLARAEARGWPVDATIAGAVRSRLAEAREPAPEFKLPPGYRLVLTNQFKWAPDYFPHWGSVFMGTTDDPVAGLEEVISAICQIPQDKRQLVAIVGGMWFLRLLGRVRFGRITVFDSNIAELAKIAHAREYILRTSWGEFDGFRRLDSMIRRGFDNFYLPASLHGIQIERNDFHFTYSGRTAPIETTISPIDYPHLAWAPSQQEYALVQENLGEAFDSSLHLRMPRLSPGMFGLAYLTHVEFPREALVRAMGSRHIVPLYGRNIDNSAALDPHIWWEWRAIYMAGNHPTVHLWAPEDAKLCGGEYDKPFGRGTTHEEFCGNPNFRHGGCLIIHMYLSKCRDEAGFARTQKLHEVLARAASHYERIIISENTRHESGARQAAEATLLPHFDLLTGPIYTPGPGEPRRNVFLSYQKGR